MWLDSSEERRPRRSPRRRPRTRRSSRSGRARRSRSEGWSRRWWPSLGRRQSSKRRHETGKGWYDRFRPAEGRQRLEGKALRSRWANKAGQEQAGSGLWVRQGEERASVRKYGWVGYMRESVKGRRRIRVWKVGRTQAKGGMCKAGRAGKGQRLSEEACAYACRTTKRAMERREELGMVTR